MKSPQHPSPTGSAAVSFLPEHDRPPGHSPVRFVPSPLGSPIADRGTTDQIGVRNGVRRTVPHQFGPLRSLIADPSVTDLFVNATGEVVVDRGAGHENLDDLVLGEPAARALATALIGAGDRHVDEANPCADVRLADGIRVHAVLPPISTGGALLSIRVPALEPLSLDDLEASGAFATVPRALLVDLIHRRVNLLITGAAGSGKTTLLSALLAEASPTDRIITLEDVAELRIDHPHVVSLETRQANLEGAGEIGLARLVREALRMNPGRLIVGECRGPEIRELLTALNTGHDGGAGTLHANGLDAVPARLEAVGALAELSPAAVARQAVSAFGAVVHLSVGPLGRRVSGVARLTLDDEGRLTTEAYR